MNSIAKLHQKDAIVQCESKRNQFVSSIFVIPKTDDSSRFILNLKRLNVFIQTEHFNLENRKIVVNLISEGCFMAKIDLKDAYHTISITKSD